MERIIVATDGSRGARAAVAEGIELARRTGAKVTFVAVRHRTNPLLGDPFYQRRLSEQLRRVQAALDEAAAESERSGVDAEQEILEGNVVEEVLAVAAYRDADLIVVGSRGLGAVSGLLLGSVSRALVETSPIPVLVAKEREAGRTGREPAKAG